MPILPIPNRVMAGRSSSPKSSAGTTIHDYKFETRIVRFHNVYGPSGNV